MTTVTLTPNKDNRRRLEIDNRSDGRITACLYLGKNPQFTVFATSHFDACRVDPEAEYRPMLWVGSAAFSVNPKEIAKIVAAFPTIKRDI